MLRCYFSAPEHPVIDVVECLVYLGLRGTHRWSVLPGSEEQQSKAA